MLNAASSMRALGQYTFRFAQSPRFFRSLLISLMILLFSFIFKKLLNLFKKPFKYQKISFTTFDKPSHISKVLDIFDKKGLDIHGVKITSLGNNEIKITLLVKRSCRLPDESFSFGSVIYIDERSRDKSR